jgi:RimJ/RimL family protein N-acetyltransferase
MATKIIKYTPKYLAPILDCLEQYHKAFSIEGTASPGSELWATNWHKFLRDNYSFIIINESGDFQGCIWAYDFSGNAHCKIGGFAIRKFPPKQTRQIIQDFCHHLFTTLNIKLILAEIKEWNRSSKRAILFKGFKLYAKIPHFYGYNEPCLLYGLTVEDFNSWAADQNHPAFQTRLPILMAKIWWEVVKRAENLFNIIIPRPNNKA